MEKEKIQQIPSLYDDLWNTQNCETNWSYDNGKCKILIETNGEVDSDDILAQCQHTINGLGYVIDWEEEIK